MLSAARDERSERFDANERTDAAEPTEPIESTEPSLAIDRIESFDLSDQSDSILRL